MAKRRKNRTEEEPETVSAETITEASAPDEDAAVYVPHVRVEEEAPKVEEAPSKKQPPSKKRPNPDAVSLRIFLTASGVKLDQMAGFQNFAITQKLSPRTMTEWRETYSEFMHRPVN